MTQADLRVGLYERQHEPQSHHEPQAVTETQVHGFRRGRPSGRPEPPGGRVPDEANSGYQLPRSPNTSISRLIRSNPPAQFRRSPAAMASASPRRVARMIASCSATDKCSSVMIELAYSRQYRSTCGVIAWCSTASRPPPAAATIAA